MSWLIALICLNLLLTLGLGVYLEFRPMTDGKRAQRWWRGTLATNLVVFVGASLGALLLGMQDALAQQAAAPHGEISVGLGLALLGAGIPTGLAAFGAGLAVGPVGAASLAIISEKPEMFGRTLIYLGLAEGIAIYGLVVTILLLGRIA
ncbi:ATPase [Ferrigenium kumadai]|uniref:ATPase n=1 Tax=Ferrigenium kumadai TaxID=1682490 RepID=A0AAN1W0M2_9PROT|nr:ATP synthase subunit C [Ferrigenium kumadai]BBI99452.1 ATPase [Ferrigenium kumadai]